MKATLLLELGTEELPPKALRPMAQALAQGIADGLRGANLSIGQVEALGSPRRLAVRIADVAEKAPDRELQRLGPAVAAAFDDGGQPTKAARGFARSCGVDVCELEQQDTDKGKRLAYNGIEDGQTLAALLPGLFADAIKRLPIPKRMRWGMGEHSFVRPVHWLVALHGEQVLPLQAFGCGAGNQTRGHRFHHPSPIVLTHADDYVTLLENPGRVIVDMDRRRRMVEQQVQDAARNCGGEAICRHALLDEVAALVEWPVALSGSFDARYLALPREVLIATLEGHQRYFPVVDDDAKLLARFVTVANIESRDPERIVTGNQRVVRPRLADALFFWDRDRDRGLEALARGLGRVTFQRKLGSLADKSARVERIAQDIAAAVGADPAAVARACHLAKTDLLTEIVGEFPELQGTMGAHYARQAGENEAVALALDEQYAPRQARAPIASHRVGQVLALADRLDTLAGIFAIGGRPTGEKDPYALRRAALGVLRTCIEAELDLDLRKTLTRACELQPVTPAAADPVEDLLAFHLDRLRSYYHDRGFGADSFEAVAAAGLSHPSDFENRMLALQAFLGVPAASQLCSAHKRIRNILKNVTATGDVEANLLTEPAEQQLHQALTALLQTLPGLMQTGDYQAALEQLATLEQPLDRFFAEVLVMCEDAAVKNNRLALLAGLDGVCRSVADISRLTSDEKAAA